MKKKIEKTKKIKNAMLEIGDKMPEFKLPDQDGKIISSKDLLKSKKKVLIYFYPKDDTPGCTTEACGFRDFRYELQDEGVEIIGISKDSVASHKKFATKYKLNFSLLSDESTDTIAKFGAWQEKSMYGRKYMGIARISYLFDIKGKVEKVYGKVDTKIHAKEVLSDAK
jgi:peroxiredoxin Q/BCP